MKGAFLVGVSCIEGQVHCIVLLDIHGTAWSALIEGVILIAGSVTLYGYVYDNRYSECQLRLNEMERAAKELGGKLEEVQVARSTAEADLAIEKQWRASLQVEQFPALFSYTKHVCYSLYMYIACVIDGDSKRERSSCGAH